MQFKLVPYQKLPASFLRNKKNNNNILLMCNKKKSLGNQSWYEVKLHQVNSDGHYVAIN